MIRKRFIDVTHYGLAYHCKIKDITVRFIWLDPFAHFCSIWMDSNQPDTLYDDIACSRLQPQIVKNDQNTRWNHWEKVLAPQM